MSGAGGLRRKTQVDLLCLDTGKPPQNEKRPLCRVKHHCRGTKKKRKRWWGLPGSPLVRIRLPVQGTWVQSLIREIHTPREQLSPWAASAEVPHAPGTSSAGKAARDAHGARRPAAALSAETFSQREDLHETHGSLKTTSFLKNKRNGERRKEKSGKEKTLSLFLH